METFNLNIQHSIRYSIQKFDYSIPKFNTNLQSKHSIRTFTWNIQFEHSIRTFTVRTCNPNIQFEHSIRICNSNIQLEHSIGTFNSNIQFEHSIQTFNSMVPRVILPTSGTLGTRKAGKKGVRSRGCTCGLRNFSAFSVILPTI